MIETAEILNLQTNQIVHGDCLNLLRQCPDQSIDMICTDPPFNILNKTNLHLADHADIVQTCDFDQFADYDTFIAFTRQWVELCARKMKPNATFLSFFATQYITDLIRICESLEMIQRNIMVWYKVNPALRVRKTNFLSSYESMVYMAKGEPPFNFFNQNEMHNCFIFPLTSQKERLKTFDVKQQKDVTLHPTQKPEALIQKIILTLSNPRDIICDPFAGTGTVNVAALHTGRYCLGIEKDAVFCQRAQSRLSSAEGNSSRVFQSTLGEWK